MCLTDKQRAFGFGLQRVIVRLLGNVPAPIVLGLIFDTSCQVWQYICGEEGSCWIYDTKFVAYYIFYACCFIKGISALCLLIALIIYRPPPISSEEKLTIEINADTKGDLVKEISGKTNLALQSCAEEVDKETMAGEVATGTVERVSSTTHM